MSFNSIMYIIFTVVIFGLIVYAIILTHSFRDTNKKLVHKNEAYNSLQKEFELYRNAEQFKKEKEEEVDEKIDSLHNGTLSADDILPKRTSSL